MRVVNGLHEAGSEKRKWKIMGQMTFYSCVALREIIVTNFHVRRCLSSACINWQRYSPAVIFEAKEINFGKLFMDGNKIPSILTQYFSPEPPLIVEGLDFQPTTFNVRI